MRLRLHFLTVVSWVVVSSVVFLSSFLVRQQSARRISSGIPAHPKISLPLTFEVNVGQAGARAEFVVRGSGATVLLTREGLEIAGAGRASNPDKARSIAIRFVDARRGQEPSVRNVRWEGAERLASETNYFLGKDRARWRTHVPHFAKAEAREVIRGVDVVAYGSDEQLEYDLRVAPGTNPADLRLAISGGKNLHIDSSGDLVMTSGGRDMRMRKPSMYEERDEHPRTTGRARRKTVEGEYAMEADGTVGFRVGTYDPAATLVIDPSLSVGYVTFLGGAGDDRATSVALDADGNVYVGGTTTSVSTFVETSGVKQGAEGGVRIFSSRKSIRQNRAPRRCRT